MTKDKETLSYQFEQWYEIYRKPKVREITQQAYRIAIEHIKRDPIGEMEFKKIRRKEMQLFFNRFGKKRRLSTVLDLKGLLNSCFADAVHDGIMKINPVARVEVTSIEDTWTVQQMKEKREEKKWLEKDEYKRFKMKIISILTIAFNHDESERIEITEYGKKEPIMIFQRRRYPAQMTLMGIYIALKTGARFSEILGITEEDYDFENKILNIDKSWDYKFNKTFAPTKNNSSVRKIILDDEFSAVLKAYLNWIKHFDIPINQGAIMVRKQEQVHNSSFNDTLKTILTSLNIERISFHKLRHTHASLLVDAGISLQVVAKRLGHRDTNMVQTTYAHLLKKTEEEENERILQLL